MKYIEGIMDYTFDRSTAVTLGKFDGVHRGHRELIGRICEKKTENLDSVAVTIWPDPGTPALLTKGEKKECFRKLGVQWWIDCPFLPQIAHMEPEDFVREILCGRLHAKYIAVGKDFHFGYQRKGDCALLARMQEECGYELEIVEKVRCREREISSSFVRETLEKGDMGLVEELLGYPYTVQGEVLHGRKIGRTLGMPTINLIPSAGKLLPPNGVYATKTLLRDGNGEAAACWKGVTNIGCKPTVGGYFRGVETYLFDFDGDLYGRSIEVQLYSYERPEQKFAGLEKLKEQMQRDIRFGKKYWS